MRQLPSMVLARGEGNSFFSPLTVGLAQSPNWILLSYLLNRAKVISSQGIGEEPLRQMEGSKKLSSASERGTRIYPGSRPLEIP